MPAPRIRVFVSYDRESDDDLYELLSQQASNGTSRFQISARSPARSTADSDTSQRRAIQEADQVIILCGARSEHSENMGVELRIAQEEQRPYLLLWGRRALMCTKPPTARSADVMYSWTSGDPRAPARPGAPRRRCAQIVEREIGGQPKHPRVLPEPDSHRSQPPRPDRTESCGSVCIEPGRCFGIGRGGAATSAA